MASKKSAPYAKTPLALTLLCAEEGFPNGILIYNLLWHLAVENKAYMKISTLEKMGHVKRRTVQKALAWLEEKGFITGERRIGRPTIYSIRDERDCWFLDPNEVMKRLDEAPIPEPEPRAPTRTPPRAPEDTPPRAPTRTGARTGPRVPTRTPPRAPTCPPPRAPTRIQNKMDLPRCFEQDVNPNRQMFSKLKLS